MVDSLRFSSQAVMLSVSKDSFVFSVPVCVRFIHIPHFFFFWHIASYKFCFVASIFSPLSVMLAVEFFIVLYQAEEGFVYS